MGVYWTFRQILKKRRKKRLFVYLSFNLYHFGQMWHLCTIYCFQMYCAMNSGFSEKKTGPQKRMEQIWYSCRVRRDLHLFNATFRATLTQSCRVRMKHFFPAALLHCLNILYVLYIDVNSVVLQSGLSAILWHSWRCNGVARGDGGQKHLCIVWD